MALHSTVRRHARRRAFSLAVRRHGTGGILAKAWSEARLHARLEPRLDADARDTRIVRLDDVRVALRPQAQVEAVEDVARVREHRELVQRISCARIDDCGPADTELGVVEIVAEIAGVIPQL